MKDENGRELKQVQTKAKDIIHPSSLILHTSEKTGDLKIRTKKFALRVVRVYCSLPKSTEAQVLGKQLLRSGTSVGAHYRESVRSRSQAEFISKLEGGLQELEETLYWMELLVESGILGINRMQNLMDEANQLIAILTTCVKKIKGKNEERKTS
jgi:four helix bundle protein